MSNRRNRKKARKAALREARKERLDKLESKRARLEELATFQNEVQYHPGMDELNMDDLNMDDWEESDEDRELSRKRELEIRSKRAEKQAGFDPKAA